MPDRRMFISALGALFALPTAWAQRPRKPLRIGFPSIVPRQAFEHLAQAFEQGLRDHGYVLGTDVVIDYRSAEGRIERYPEVAQEVVRSNPDVIVTGVNAATTPVKALTRAIPIVMMVGTDVIRQGYAKSFAKPGGNITGLTRDVASGTIGKRLELLKEAVPNISRVTVMFDPPYEEEYGQAIREAASVLGVKLSSGDITDDFERSFAAAAREPVDAVLTQGGPRMFARRAELIALAAKHRLPAAYHDLEYVEAGGLMSYGPNLAALFRAGARFVDKILKGARPGDLPIEQPTRFDLAINLKTASALGLRIPQTVLLRAERVVE